MESGGSFDNPIAIDEDDTTGVEDGNKPANSVRTLRYRVIQIPAGGAVQKPSRRAKKTNETSTTNNTAPKPSNAKRKTPAAPPDKSANTKPLPSTKRVKSESRVADKTAENEPQAVGGPGPKENNRGNNRGNPPIKQRIQPPRAARNKPKQLFEEQQQKPARKRQKRGNKLPGNNSAQMPIQAVFPCACPSGVLKSSVPPCPAPCGCPECAAIRSAPRTTNEFSEFQVRVIRCLARSFVGELKAMRRIVEQNVISRADGDGSAMASSSKLTEEEIRAATVRASELEQMARDRVAAMSRDCDRYCEILKHPKQGERQ